MKIDEAISLLKQYIDYNNPDIPDFYTMEDAIKVIIKALEQEPTDMISRQAVLEVIRKCHCEEWVKTDIGAHIDALQSVTAQPKIGRWIYTGDHLTDGMLKCSECGFEHDVSERFLYCPNCGAKMSAIPTEAEGSDKE